MPDLEASRTLVKSAPELWAECSDAASLSKHLGAFGEIRITQREPETAVAWEGDAARGTVRLEPSGWGTRVVLTADGDPSAERPSVEAEPVSQLPELSAEPPGGRLSRLLSRWSRRGRTPAHVPAADEPPSEPGMAPLTVAALDATLDSLGRAHHRPYSRG